MKKVKKLNKRLWQDVISVIGSIYSTNSPYAIGYLFNPSNDRRTISNGMFCDRKSEIDKNQWTYFVNYTDKCIYKI